MTEVSSISATSSVSSPSAADAYNTAKAELESKHLKHHGKAGKAENDDSQDGGIDIPSAWGFDKQQAHKLQENLCNACVTVIKNDDARMKDANSDLKKTFEGGN